MGVEGLDDVLLLADGISGDGGVILEVELPVLERPGPLHRHSFAAWWVRNALIAGQNLPDGAGRARHQATRCLEHLVTSQIVQDSLRTWRALQVFRGMIADVQDSLDGCWTGLGWWVFAGGGATPQRRFIVSRGFPQALHPFLDPSQRTVKLISVFLTRPVGVVAEQFAQVGTVSN